MANSTYEREALWIRPLDFRSGSVECRNVCWDEIFYCRFLSTWVHFLAIADASDLVKCLVFWKKKKNDNLIWRCSGLHIECQRRSRCQKIRRTYWLPFCADCFRSLYLQRLFQALATTDPLRFMSRVIESCARCSFRLHHDSVPSGARTTSEFSVTLLLCKVRNERARPALSINTGSDAFPELQNKKKTFDREKRTTVYREKCSGLQLSQRLLLWVFTALGRS